MRGRRRAALVFEIWVNEGTDSASVSDSASKVVLPGNLLQTAVLAKLAYLNKVVLVKVNVKQYSARGEEQSRLTPTNATSLLSEDRSLTGSIEFARALSTTVLVNSPH